MVCRTEAFPFLYNKMKIQDSCFLMQEAKIIFYNTLDSITPCGTRMYKKATSWAAWNPRTVATTM